MSQTREGAKKQVETMRRKYGQVYIEDRGAKGGSARGPEYRKGGNAAKGFAANPELAKKAGALGGSISRRGRGK